MGSDKHLHRECRAAGVGVIGETGVQQVAVEAEDISLRQRDRHHHRRRNVAAAVATVAQRTLKPHRLWHGIDGRQGVGLSVVDDALFVRAAHHPQRSVLEGGVRERDPDGAQAPITCGDRMLVLQRGMHR
jgi:hypothetical protein